MASGFFEAGGFDFRASRDSCRELCCERCSISAGLFLLELAKRSPLVKAPTLSTNLGAFSPPSPPVYLGTLSGEIERAEHDDDEEPDGEAQD